MTRHEEFFSTVIGNGILIIMGIAILFGNAREIGYAAITDIILLLSWLVYSFIRHPEHFKPKKN